MIYPCRHISVSIDKPFHTVYAYVSDPRNLPRWASGLSQSEIIPSGDHWIAQSPMGKVQIKFAHKNDFGVVDHDVTLPSGEIVHNPLRVLKNGDSAEVVFTLYRLPNVSHENFEADASHVLKDLMKLKDVFSIE